ncbi:MAG: hypothetical protein N2554_01540 [Fimbriimonadales bacterium]|nr:hypothetical protein [Fimbriimonadales bacterium]
MENTSREPLVVLNSTVLSNFAATGNLDLLRQLFGNTAATTQAVIQEYEEGVRLGYYAPVLLEWLVVVELTSEEQQDFVLLNRSLGAGEASCIVVAHRRGWRLATDDKQARRYAQTAQIPLSGTLGILTELVRANIITLQQADEVLQAMVSLGYRSPVNSISELISDAPMDSSLRSE